MRPFLLLSLLALSLTASAVPLEFSHQGRLFDVAGAPLTGVNTVALALYDAPSGGVALWSEEHTDVTFADGYFAVQVGSVVSLDASLFTGDTLYLGLRVNGGLELPQRLALVSVPYAVRAQDADSATVAVSVSGGVVDATELRVNGQLIADGTGLQVAPSAHEHDAAGVTSGVFAPARLPQHNHDAAELTTGTVDMNRLPVGTSADSVARGSHAHTAAEIGALPVGTKATDIGGLADTTKATDIGGLASTTRATDIGGLADTTKATDIGGLADTTTAADLGGLMAGAPVALPDNTATCGSTDAPAGSLRFHAGVFEGCVTDTWVPLVFAVGTSRSSAGQSCAAIKVMSPSSADGLYWVDPDGGNTNNAVEVWCDMTTDGGGWMLIANNDNTDVEPTGCYAQLASDPARACGSPASHSADFAVLASGLKFKELVFAAYSGSYIVSSYQYMTWTSPQTIPATTNDWWFDADAWGQSISDWGSAPHIECQYTAHQLVSVGTLAQPRGSSDYAGKPVTLFTGQPGLAAEQMSFTEYSAYASGQSMRGLDDFQDGWGCGDAWAPTADRGKSAFIMIR